MVSIDVGILSGYVKWRFLFAQVVRNLDKHNNRQTIKRQKNGKIRIDSNTIRKTLKKSPLSS